jgi:hypothetical protein
LKGCDDIFCVVFLADLSNFLLLKLTADGEQQASEDVSAPQQVPLLSGNVNYKNK